MKNFLALTTAVLMLATVTVTSSAANQNLSTETGGHVIIDERIKEGNYQRVDGGYGMWHYGSNISGTKKVCYSNLLHHTKTHMTTAKVGTASVESDWVDAGEESQASASSQDRNATAQAYWNVN